LDERAFSNPEDFAKISVGLTASIQTEVVDIERGTRASADKEVTFTDLMEGWSTDGCVTYGPTGQLPMDCTQTVSFTSPYFYHLAKSILQSSFRYQLEKVEWDALMYPFGILGCDPVEGLIAESFALNGLEALKKAQKDQGLSVIPLTG